MHGRLEQSRSPQSSATRIQDRISQLEGLVISLMSTLDAKESFLKTGHPEKSFTPANQNQAEVTESETDPQTRLPDTFGRISLENAQTSYVGSAHWIAILDSVCTFRTKSLSLFESGQ